MSKIGVAIIMKNNTKKILLALYNQNKQLPSPLSVQQLQRVVPTLSNGGFRSLLHVLAKQGLLTTQRVLQKTTVNISQQGMLSLEVEFPALSQKWDTWAGSWECLVFLGSPPFDKQFRYLRTQLISQGAFSVNRGVYLAPGAFSDVILQECQRRYHAHVLLFKVADWKVATEASFIIEKYGLLDVAEAYSGISSDVNRLLESSEYKKGLIYKDKNAISLAYDRVASVLLEDPGFCLFYFPSVVSVKKLLVSLHNLLQALE